jgi:hypothetical protein
MANNKLCCGCGEPARFDSFQQGNYGYSGNVCTNEDCYLVWQMENFSAVLL